MRRARVHRIVRIAATVAAVLCVALVGVAPAGAEPSKGLSLTQIRGVMRAHARQFNACLAASSRRSKPLHGPFVYQIEVDRHGKVLSARPYQPSGVVAFDRCVTGVLKQAKFPGGPASVETALVFDAD
jgi:outer membrane biosynthesis protein TonB